MAMTGAQRLTIRRRTSAASDELSDTVLDAIYDDTTQGNSDLDRTTYYALRELLGVLAPLVDKGGEVDSLSLSSSQRFDHVEKLLPLWAGFAGVGVRGAALTTSSTYTYRADSLQAEEPTYERGTPTLGYDED